MNYVEWLRIRNCLRMLAIILAIVVVLAVILRISLSRYMSPESWITNMSNEPGTKITHTILPDGTKRTLIVNPSDNTNVVLDDRGTAGQHIVVTEPAGRAHEKNSDFSHVGNIVSSRTTGGTTTTTVDTKGSVPMIYYMAFADLVALIVATILAAPFAREIDGHLEVAMTKPVSRVRYAIGSIGVDALAILAASLLTIVALYLCQLLFETPRLDFTGVNARAIVMGAVLPVAWYALLCAGTTLLSRSYVAVLGFAWPVALLIGGLTQLEPNNIVALIVRNVAWVLSRLDPLTYVKFSEMHSAESSYAAPDFGVRLLILVFLFVVYSAIAVWQWQRVEA